MLFGRYLLQGNVRLVGVQSESGRMEARAVLRLLLRSDSMAPALFMDTIYYSTNPDTALEQQVGQRVAAAAAAAVVRVSYIPIARQIVQPPCLSFRELFSDMAVDEIFTYTWYHIVGSILR